MQLPTTVTLSESTALAKTLRDAVASGSGVMRIDASGLQAFDSSTVVLLLHARQLARTAGRSFEVIGAPASLTELARLYGVEELFLDART